MHKKVLLVEDEAVILMLLEQTLEPIFERGVEVLSASDGAEGLEAIRAHRPDLVLLDGTMPVMNGFEVCRAVRADETLRGVQITMLTARSQESDRAAAMAAGADHYLLKPFVPDEVLRHVARVLDLAI
ncbi:MAG: response regulator [Deltaproteobacteria bacterium]